MINKKHLCAVCSKVIKPTSNELIWNDKLVCSNKCLDIIKDYCQEYDLSFLSDVSELSN